MTPEHLCSLYSGAWAAPTGPCFFPVPEGTTRKRKGRASFRIPRAAHASIALLLTLPIAGFSGGPPTAFAAPVTIEEQHGPRCNSDRCNLACTCRFDEWSAERRLKYGYGMTANPKAAAYWYKRAAEGGDPRAAHNWGLMLKRGEGTARDTAAALTWLRRAAGKGALEAHTVLGNMHRLGEGVPRDATAAAAHYRQAAERGYANAQHALGNLYGNGLDGAPDLVSAYKWWRLAADKGHPLAAAAIMQAERIMTLAEVKRAERLIELWREDRARK